MTLSLSEQGARFIARHESPGGKAVSRAYRCPAGVITIGHGFTMRSRVFAAYWRAKHGRALQMGDTITQGEADSLLPRVFDEEYGAAVNARIKPARQHHYDGAGSTAFNCGPGALNWKWAKALAAGNVAEAARLLRTTAVTANGRKLAGLVRRRDEEAQLIETGKYSLTGPANEPAAVSQTAAEIKEYQRQLATLGYYKGNIDGLGGPKTTAAVRAFQGDHGLKVDGVVGPATRATLIRALDTKRGSQATGGAGAAGGAGGAGTVDTLDPTQVDSIMPVLMWGAAAAIVIVIIVLAIKYRGVLTGRRVPT